VTTSNAAPRRHAALKHALLVLAGILALTVVATFVAIVAFVPIWFLVVLIGIRRWLCCSCSPSWRASRTRSGARGGGHEVVQAVARRRADVDRDLGHRPAVLPPLRPVGPGRAGRGARTRATRPARCGRLPAVSLLHRQRPR
jgi:hypothetical protein